MKYILRQNRTDGCVFCNAIEMNDGPENLILCRGKHTFVILNRFPYTSGHLMVLPYLHVASIEDLESDILTELMEFNVICMRLLRSIYHPEAFNVGANIGAAAGAGVAEHVHIHIVPRWFGDTNFMSAVGETRVLPEALEDTYYRLKQAFSECDANLRNA
jgi:ATP adenylyltransferase